MGILTKHLIDLAGKVATVLLAILFIATPVFSLLGKGPFDWHIQQPAAWQGGAEVLALIALFFAALSLPFRRGIRIGLVVAFGWLYARRHGVDLSILLIYLYAEAIFALGWMLLPRIGILRNLRPAIVLTAGVLGVTAWSLVIWLASATGSGSVPAIRLIAVILLGACLVFGRAPRIAAVIGRTMVGRDQVARLCVALVGAFLLALFAKAAVVIDHDSMWYGLRAEQVLVGEGGLYADQGLVAFVHLYPKLYEALQLPFVGLGSISLVFGLGIFSLLLIAAAVSAILREFRLSTRARHVAVALAVTLPAFANIAVTAKGDAFSAWLMLTALLALVRYRKGAGGAWMWIGLSSMLLAVLARLSNLPYAALLFGLFLWSAWAFKRRGGAAPLGITGVWLAAGASLLAGLVLARTYILSGLLFIAPNALVSLQQQLGLEVRYPIGLLPAGGKLPRFPVFDGMRSMLFDPASLPHIVITWTGNVWAFLPLAFVLLGGIQASRGTRERALTWPMLVLGSSLFVVLFGYGLLVPGGDGNYFIVPVACLLMWGMIQANRARLLADKFLITLLLSFAICDAAIAFVTGSWGPGTRAIDARFNLLPFEHEARRSTHIAVARLQGVHQFLKKQTGSPRVIGLESAGVNAEMPSGWWLPVRYEPIEAYKWMRPDIVQSSDAFSMFLERQKIRYIIFPDRLAKETKVTRVVHTALTTAAATGIATAVYKDQDYVVWEMRNKP